MTRKKAEALGPAGPLAWWAGELVPEVPALGDALAWCGHGAVDPAAFAEWLQAPLASYRAHARAMELRGQVAAVVRWMEDAAADPAQALEDGRLTRIPAFHAEPAIGLACMRLGVDWAALVRERDAVRVGQVLTMAAASLKRQRVRRGRPSALARDSLLHLVIDRLVELGVERRQAEAAADAVLIACRVPSPEASIARAARRGSISV